MKRFLIVGAVLGTAFQAGHFVEHTVQFYHWLMIDRSYAYMSPIAMNLVHHIGSALVPHADMVRTHMVGMEVLHLIGNQIFLATLMAWYALRPSRLMKYALLVETFHMVEHMALVISALLLNHAYGLSTIGGIGYRVSWHFVMNLIPTALMIAAMRKQKRGGF